MSSALHIVVIVNFAVLVLAFILAISAFLDFLKRFYTRRKYESADPVSKFYEDEDGVATEEALKQYSARIPRYLALASTLIGFVISTVLCALYEAQPSSSEHLAYWFTFGTWVCWLSIAIFRWLNPSTRPCSFSRLYIPYRFKVQSQDSASEKSARRLRRLCVLP